MKPSRRQVLGAATSLFTLGSCRRSEREIQGGFADRDVAAGHLLRDGGIPGGEPVRRKSRVVIVGGGAAGLSAAWRLEREGVSDLTLLELGATVGGTSRGGVMEDIPHPWGAHYLPVPRENQRALRLFLEQEGLLTEGRAPADQLVRAPAERIGGLGFWEEGLWLHAGASEEDHAQLARFEELVLSFFGTDSSGRRWFDLPVASSSDHFAALDSKTAAEWATENGLTGDRIRWYLDYACRDDFGCSLEETSAWALLHYFSSRADHQSGESADYMTWPEGNQRLIDGLARPFADRIRTGRLVHRIVPTSSGAEIHALDHKSRTIEVWEAEQVVVATPQFLTRRLVTGDAAAEARATFRYAPWVVANLHLEQRPTERGFPLAWDNVQLESESLGYVDATHQLDRMHLHDTVWSWYLPLTGPGEAQARQRMLSSTWEDWRDTILADLRLPHPDIEECVTRIDVWRWGHAMVKPVPGVVFGEARRQAAMPQGRLSFAHSDLSGMALFEEALWQGVRAAEERLTAEGLTFESLL